VLNDSLIVLSLVCIVLCYNNGFGCYYGGSDMFVLEN
jgi:hypothetical protein